MTAVQNVLGNLERVKKSGDGWVAQCPAHDDQHASLSIGVGDDGRALLHCHTGCAVDAVVGAAGLQVNDLFEPDLDVQTKRPSRAKFTTTSEAVDAAHERLLGNDGVLRRLEQLRGWSTDAIRDAHVGLDGARVLFPYRNESGELTGVGRYHPNAEARSGPKLVADPGSRRDLFPSPEGLNGHNGPVLLVEGEPDALAARSAGLVAIAVPGVNGWRPGSSERFTGRSVVVVFDCDQPGREAAKRVAEDLASAGVEVRILDLDRGRDDGFDITDLLRVAKTDVERDQARQLVESSLTEAPLFVSASKKQAWRKRISEGNKELPFGPIHLDVEGEPEEPDWVWRGFIAPTAVTLWSGSPKVGKTTMLFALLEAIAAGKPFLGLETRRHGALLLTEERRGTLAAKTRQWKLDGVHDLRRQAAGDASWPDIVEQAVNYCFTNDLKLLVVDTFSEWARIVNENEAGEILRSIGPLQEAAAAGLAVVVISHQRKAPGTHGERVRGSNALTGAVDIVVELERSHGFGAGNVRVIRAESRYDQTPSDLVAALTDDGYVALGDSESAKSEDERERVEATIKELDGATTDEVAEASDLPKATVRRHATRLFEKERVGRTGAGKKGDPHVWQREFVSATVDSLLAETNWGGDCQ